MMNRNTNWMMVLVMVTVLGLAGVAGAGLDTRVYYPFDAVVDVGTTGDVTYGTDYFADQSGNGHNTVVQREGSGFGSNAATAAGKFGNAFRLERGNAENAHTYSETAHTTDLGFVGTDDFTFSMWSHVNYAQAWRRGNYFGKADMDTWDLGGASQGYLFWRQAGNGATGQIWRVNDTTGHEQASIGGDSGNAWDDGQWALWTIVHDAATNTSKFYVNGDEKGQVVHTTTNWANTEPFTIGSRLGQHQRAFTWPVGNQGTGLIDDFAAVGDALTATEVLALFNLAEDATLGYAFGDTEVLLSLHRDGTGTGATSDGLTWAPATGLTGTPGEVQTDGSGYWLVLDANGGGVVGRQGGDDIIPEPATMALAGLAACGLGGYVRRRRRA